MELWTTEPKMNLAHSLLNYSDARSRFAGALMALNIAGIAYDKAEPADLTKYIGEFEEEVFFDAKEVGKFDAALSEGICYCSNYEGDRLMTCLELTNPEYPVIMEEDYTYDKDGNRVDLGMISKNTDECMEWDNPLNIFAKEQTKYMKELERSIHIRWDVFSENRNVVCISTYGRVPKWFVEK